MKRIAVFILLVIMVFCFSACGDGKVYTCTDCDKETTKAYYDMKSDKENVMCEDCARKYWMPLDYKTYRVR
ncbi:MAG: hypothetical protein IJB70_03685 [Clostridia bacterium]|nr:hypothetical protein [Clostridia bacterium]